MMTHRVVIRKQHGGLWECICNNNTHDLFYRQGMFFSWREAIDYGFFHLRLWKEPV